MNVKNVVIINDFNYIQGGASKVAIQTAKLLNEKGIKVYFFSAVNKEEEKINGIEYITTGQNEALKEKNKVKGAINGIYNIKAKKQLKKLLKTLNKDETIIHVHGWTKALSSSVFSIAFKMKFKVILTLHDYFTACPNGGYYNYKKEEICKLKPLSNKCIKCNCDSRNYAFKLYRIIRQFVQNKIVKLNAKLDNVIVISDFSKKILEKTIGSQAKITKIYNPIQIENNYNNKISIEDNDYYLYTGRISKEKGVDLFCKAMTDLKLNGIVVGSGEEKEKLETNFKNIKFVGWQKEEVVYEYMKKAKALIFTSKWYETAGLTILEAQQFGTYCFVPKSCAGSEFIEENINGEKFTDYDDLVKKIKLFETKKAQKFEVKENKYNMEKYFNDLMNLYKET